jgi:hypothetical protein
MNRMGDALGLMIGGQQNIEPRLNGPTELNWVNRKDAKVAKRDYLLVCFDPGRKIQDQNTPSPDGRLQLEASWGRTSAND